MEWLNSTLYCIGDFKGTRDAVEVSFCLGGFRSTGKQRGLVSVWIVYATVYNLVKVGLELKQN